MEKKPNEHFGQPNTLNSTTGIYTLLFLLIEVRTKILPFVEAPFSRYSTSLAI